MIELRRFAAKLRCEFVCSMFYWSNYGFVNFGNMKIDKEANITFK